MSDVVGPPAGWYTNQNGQQQWWDGKQWGVLAPTTPPLLGKPYKQTGVAYVLLIFLGGFGAHRFYLNQVRYAVVFLVLWLGAGPLLFTSQAIGNSTNSIASGVGVFIGGLMWVVLGIMYIVDLCVLAGDVRRVNQRNGYAR